MHVTNPCVKHDSCMTVTCRFHSTCMQSNGNMHVACSTFAFSETRLKNFAKSFRAPRVHGNTKTLPYNTLSISSVEYVTRFLLNYTDQNGLLLPGCIPGYSRSDIKLLPSSVSKRGIWRVIMNLLIQQIAFILWHM